MALTHEKLGHTQQGLWHHKGMQLPAYIQHIAKDLHEERGMPLSVAIATAISQCKKWAAGGEDVKPETRAKAAAAIAEWERLRATSHAKSATRGAEMADYERDGFDSSWDGDHSDLPDLTGLGVEEFEDADTGDDVSRAEVDRLAKLGSGGRFAALKGALAKKGARNPGALAAWIGRKKYGKGKFASLASKARSKKGGGSGQAEGHGFRERVSRSEIFRFYPLEDIQILTRAEGAGGGRIVEAYATVFEQEAEIHDQHGDYREVIDRTAFDAVLARHARAPGGLRGNVKVLYNHGKTIEGAPAPEFQIPIGVPLEIRPEKRGLLTRTEYDPGDPLAERILSKIHAGAITTQSFVGAIMRSDPELRGYGDRYGSRGRGPLPLVRRIMLGLREYGPVLFASYTGAEILGVRMSLPGDTSWDEEPGFNEDEGFAAEDEAPDTARSRQELPSSTDVSHRIYVQRMGEGRPWQQDERKPEWQR